MNTDSSQFIHIFRPAKAEPASTLVLLHGTGGNETSLLPVVDHLSPGATVLSLRGRSLDEGFPRWFRRLTAVSFDQDNIISEAAALATFLQEAVTRYRLDPDRTIYLGYSNGANMLGAMALLHPGVIRNAILIRAMNVLETIPEADLTGTRILMTTGARDPYGPYAPALERALLSAGASVENTLLDTGHDLGMPDIAQARDWMKTAGL